MHTDYLVRCSRSAFKNITWLFAGVCFFYVTSFAQSARPSKKSPAEDPFPAINIDIREHLKVFMDSAEGAIYRISICADVPNNKKPLQVAYHQETGHVFLVLQKISAANDTVSRVFGFYPKRGLQTLLFKKTHSRIKDNSLREHDAVISKELSAKQFDTVLSKAITYAGRKYHMNRYNCYDYALAIFNCAAGEVSLPVNHIRFPFIFGRGGSPCSVYKDLQKLLLSGPVWKPHIMFGELIAPVSNGREKGLPAKLLANQ